MAPTFRRGPQGGRPGFPWELNPAAPLKDGAEPSKYQPERRRGSRGERTGERSMGILSWIILGAVAGFLGSKIFEGSGKGFLMNTALGIVGAIVGGFLTSAIFGWGVSGFNLPSIISAVVGSLVVLWGYNKMTGQRL